MITKAIALESTGYESWLELFEDMVDQNLASEPEIVLTWPGDDMDDLKISMDHIRARAFEEVYPSLPLQASKDVVLDMFENGQSVQSAEFIKNLKTRRK